MSLKLAKGPLFGGLAILILAGIVFAGKSFAPDFELVGLSLADYGDLFAIALGVFALMLGALSLVMAKPVPKAPKNKKAKAGKESNGEDGFSLLDEDTDAGVNADDGIEIDEKTAKKLEAQRVKQARAAEKKAAAEAKKAEKLAAAEAKKAEKQDSEKSSFGFGKKKTSEDAVEDEGIELIGEESSSDLETLNAPVRPAAVEEPSVDADDIETDEPLLITEAEMLEEAPAQHKPLSAQEKRDARVAKKAEMKRARETARFQKAAEKDAAKAAKAAEKGAAKGLIEENPYEMLEDGQIILPETQNDDIILPEEEVNDETPNSEELAENSEYVELNEETVAEDSEVSAEADELTASQDELETDELTEESDTTEPVSESETEVEETQDEATEEADEPSLYSEIESPVVAKTPEWFNEAYNDDRFVVPFSAGTMNAERDEKIDALMNKVDDLLSRIAKAEEEKTK